MHGRGRRGERRHFYFPSRSLPAGEIATVPLHSNGDGDSVRGLLSPSLPFVRPLAGTSTSNATGRWISSFSRRSLSSTAEMVIYTNDRSSLEWNRARLWDVFFNLVAATARNIFPFSSPAPRR